MVRWELWWLFLQFSLLSFGLGIASGHSGQPLFEMNPQLSPVFLRCASRETRFDKLDRLALHEREACVVMVFVSFDIVVNCFGVVYGVVQIPTTACAMKLSTMVPFDRFGLHT